MDTLASLQLVRNGKDKILASNEMSSFVIPERLKRAVRFDKSLVNYVEKVTDEYIRSSNLLERKSKGQFFTPKEVALFMANMFVINKPHISLLDPGAGIGMLSAAFCSRILDSDKSYSFSIDAFENDPILIPYLKKVLEKCKSELEEKGHAFTYKIVEKDFILDNPNYINKGTLFETKDAWCFYDYIISNPPYYKLNKDAFQSRLMKEFVSGQPNIYTFFMALSLEMLKPTGQMVFITPRSFCSGLYFKRFRKWLLRHGTINKIHMFESRKDVFDKDGVLQENVIIGLTPMGNADAKRHVEITTSKDKAFCDLQKINVDYEDILHRKNGDTFIKIPSRAADIKTQHIISSWKYTLKDLGIKASTGPVVSFRAKKHLSYEFRDIKTTAPLLWMHNIQGIDVIWPLQNKKKEQAIKLDEKTKPLLVPVDNYVLVKRFSSKEQKRRLYAGVFLKSEFDFEKVGIENHINYIHKSNDILSDEEAYGIAGILNTSIIDGFFRMMNGNTQVNAVDIMNLPLPSIEDIRRIGKEIKKNKPSIGFELDITVSDILGIEREFVEMLYRENK